MTDEKFNSLINNLLDRTECLKKLCLLNEPIRERLMQMILFLSVASFECLPTFPAVLCPLSQAVTV